MSHRKPCYHWMFRLHLNRLLSARGVCCQPDSKISIQLEISIFDIKVNNERAVQFRKWAGQAVYV